MRRLLANFSSISQFVPGLPGGMCGLIATLGTQGTHFDFSADGIRDIFRWERAQGYCASNGAQNIYSVHAALLALGRTAKLTDYGTYTQIAFHRDLKVAAGIHPILVEYANGQALTGDEVGLHYHFETIGGIDDTIADEGLIGGYACCDGDWRGNWPDNRPTPPLWHTWPTLARAQPIAYILVTA